MGIANIKIPSEEISELRCHTGEKTGQKAVQKALIYYLKEARQRRIVKALQDVSFLRGFNPLKLRRYER